jgi:hypothetical protein
MRFGMAPICHVEALALEASTSSRRLPKRCNAKAHCTLRLLPRRRSRRRSPRIVAAHQGRAMMQGVDRMRSQPGAGRDDPNVAMSFGIGTMVPSGRSRPRSTRIIAALAKEVQSQSGLHPTLAGQAQSLRYFLYRVGLRFFS